MLLINWKWTQIENDLVTILIASKMISTYASMAFAYTGSTSIASYSKIGDAATYYALAYAARSDTSTK